MARAVSLGAAILPFDCAPFREVAALLYDGPWVAKRLAEVVDFVASHADDFDPAVRKIIEGARGKTAVEAFNGLHRHEALRKIVAPVWAAVDMLLLPTAPTTCTMAEILADPVTMNSHFGGYSNFANLPGYAALAVLAGFGPSGLPVGVTRVGSGYSDVALARFARAMHQAAACGIGKDRTATVPDAPQPTVPEGFLPICVVGAHLTGLPLAPELTGPGGYLIGAARTTPGHRLYALPGTVPPKPGLILAPAFAGPGLAVEVWALPAAVFGAFVARIPAPLGIGKIALADGRQVSGFLCEAHALQGAAEITSYGGCRAYKAAQS